MRAVFVLTLGLIVAPALRADETISKPILVPYRLTDTKHVLVRAKINGKGPYNFIVDTGAPALFVATKVCKKLGVEPDKNQWGTFDRFEVEGGAVLTKFRGRIEDPFQLEGMNGLGLAGAEIHGIIGYTVLARYRLGFDFTKDKMEWTPLAFTPPDPEGLGEGVSMPEGLNMMGGIMKMLGGMLGRKADQEVSPRGFLGVELADEDGIVVKAVLAGGPAAKAGLKAGDHVTEVQGKPVEKAAEVVKAAAKVGKGQEIEWNIKRGSDQQTIRVKMGEGL